MAVNKPMFAVGTLLILATVVVFLFVEQDLGAAPIVLGIIGILMIGVSKYRPLKDSENQQNMTVTVIIGGIAVLFIIALVLYVSLLG